MRGHDVEDFTDEMSSYFEEKGKFYQGILDPTPYNNEVIGLLEEAIETMDEIHRTMNTNLLPIQIMNKLQSFIERNKDNTK